MKKTIVMAVRMIVTLALVAPVVLLALELELMGPIHSPRHELVRTWDIEHSTHDARLRFVFSIHEDGTVKGTVEAVGGTIGKVGMKDAHLERNRHWFSKMLGQRSDYKVEGHVEKSPVEEPHEWFWIEFNCDQEGSMTRINAGF
ncbi:MAG: hypothetical protein V2I51_22300 [Anderseniella sp.]|jgi:hypothetical protein|nr:hypothetical protein [Anderseniella sp.]